MLSCHVSLLLTTHESLSCHTGDVPCQLSLCLLACFSGPINLCLSKRVLVFPRDTLSWHVNLHLAAWVFILPYESWQVIYIHMSSQMSLSHMSLCRLNLCLATRIFVLPHESLFCHVIIFLATWVFILPMNLCLATWVFILSVILCLAM